MNQTPPRLLRIGVFYDGGFFHHISNYYRYAHPRKQRISVPGLHEFIRVHAAECEGVDPAYAHIVDAHFFRGRFSAQQTLAREKLYTAANGRIKVEVGVARGKMQVDKRETIRRREADLDARRAMRARNWR